MTPPEEEDATAARAALKRFGAAGFLFFLAKGLVWLALGAGVYLL